MFADRVLSGMRPTGRMHIGHYHGALKNWVRLQEEYECLYFAADWHALTTHYEGNCVASEIDLPCSYVGGSQELIDAILTDPAIEALPATLADGITYDSDMVNR